MTTAIEAAKYLLTLDPVPEERDTSNLKLQKLLYYAQGAHLARYREPLFSDELQAWDHGPVCPSVYRAYRSFGGNPIPAPEDFNAAILSRKAQEILDDTYRQYGQFSAWRLRNMTHAEPPWKRAYRAAENVVIPLDSLVDFFSCSLPVGSGQDILVDQESFAEIVERVRNPRQPTQLLRELLARSG